jgi:hypothetical protein
MYKMMFNVIMWFWNTLNCRDTQLVYCEWINKKPIWLIERRSYNSTVVCYICRSLLITTTVISLHSLYKYTTSINTYLMWTVRGNWRFNVWRYLNLNIMPNRYLKWSKIVNCGLWVSRLDLDLTVINNTVFNILRSDDHMIIFFMQLKWHISKYPFHYSKCRKVNIRLCR